VEFFFDLVGLIANFCAIRTYAEGRRMSKQLVEAPKQNTADLKARVMDAFDSFLAHRADTISIEANQRRLRRKRRALFGRRQ